MKIFELYFNPKSKEDRIYDSFIYEPTNSSEKHLGNLYMIGELKNSVSQQSLLTNLNDVIKRKYYSLSNKNTSKAISESLKEANDFLSEEIKKENVSWLGNLNFSVLTLKDFDLSFTSTGDLKMVLIRSGQINDIGKNINSADIEPYPLKVFFNVVSGKLMENDIILVLTKEVFDFLKEQAILDKISQTGEINEKKLKDIFPQNIFNEGAGKSVSGVCFMVYLEPKSKPLAVNPYQNIGKKAKEMVFEKPKESLLASKIGKVKNAFSKTPQLNIFSKLKKKKEKPTEPEPPVKKVPVLSEIKSYSRKPAMKNNLILIGTFIVILLIGFLVFKSDEKSKQSENQKFLEQIEEKMKKGQELMTTNEQEANILLREALEEVGPFAQDKKSPLYTEAESLKEFIEDNLGILSKLEKIEYPESFIDLNPNKIGFVAQNISFLNSIFYFSSPVSKDLYLYDKKEESGEKIKGNYNLELDDDLSDFTLFFSKEGYISYVSDKELKEEEITVLQSYDFRSFSSFNMNLYFVDDKTNEIIKYSHSGNFKWKEPESALKPDTKIKSMAIDGFVWILNENNEIEGYYKGEKQKSFKVDIFPDVKNITKIRTKTELPYLYLLEPINNRVIVIDKNGNLIRQFRSDEFDNIKDLSISDNGNTIYILNGSSVYDLSIE